MEEGRGGREGRTAAPYIQQYPSIRIRVVLGALDDGTIFRVLPCAEVKEAEAEDAREWMDCADDTVSSSWARIVWNGKDDVLSSVSQQGRQFSFKDRTTDSLALHTKNDPLQLFIVLTDRSMEELKRLGRGVVYRSIDLEWEESVRVGHRARVERDGSTGDGGSSRSEGGERHEPRSRSDTKLICGQHMVELWSNRYDTIARLFCHG